MDELNLLSITQGLAQRAAELFIALVLLLAVFVLAVVVGVLLIVKAVFPILLRAGCVALFVGGLVWGGWKVGELYLGLTDWPGALFASGAMVFSLICMPASALLARKRTWAAFALAGLCGLCLGFLSLNVTARFAARGLPVALAVAGLVFIMLKYRRNYVR